MRQFFGFCLERKWLDENPAKKIKAPRNIRPEEVVPYTAAEVSRILAACDVIGPGPYERLRAQAMVLLLRYTGLRISDVATLERDRRQGGQLLLHPKDRWRRVSADPRRTTGGAERGTRSARGGR